MKAPLEQIGQRLGLSLAELERCLLVLGSGHAAFEAALPRLERLFASIPDYGIVLGIADKAGWKRLGRARKTELVRLGPHRLGFARWLRRLRPRAVLALDPAAAPPWLLRACEKRSIPLLSGLAGESELARHLPPLSASGGRPSDWRRPTRLVRLANGPLAGPLDRLVRRRALGDLDALAAMLGRPRRILCLGNGPSSLSREAAQASFDVLMRVNWRWSKDPATPQAHRRPSVVFCGDSQSLLRLESPVFACQNREEARSLLLLCLSRGRLPRFRLLLLHELLPALAARLDSMAKPTNGAWMLALGAALQPAELLLAGYDLYRHPAGRYPWDARGNNAYARVHERAAELAFMRQGLAGYRGRLTILSPLLAAALAPEATDETKGAGR